jgi:Mrp family chromosome partitioning ATPase
MGSLRRFSYDFIIIDTPALSAAPTVSHLVATADATLLAVRSGVTTARSLRRAADQIPEAKRIGLALIDAKATT